jgi:hypothetical protein
VEAREGVLQVQKIFKNDPKIFKKFSKIFADKKKCLYFFFFFRFMAPFFEPVEFFLGDADFRMI